MTDELNHFLGDLHDAGALEAVDRVFTLDPESARRKMGEFRAFFPPHSWVFFHSAAVAGGAESVSLASGSKSWSFEAYGWSLAPEQLRNLYSSVFFPQGEEAAADLALAGHAALTNGAARVEILSGDRRLLLSAEGEELEELEEVLGQTVMMRVSGAPEFKQRVYVEGRLRYSPVPLKVEGTPVFHRLDSRVLAASSHELPLQLELEAGVSLPWQGSEKALVILTPGQNPKLRFIHHGVCHEEPNFRPPFPVQAFLWVDSLPRDLSRSRLIKTPEYEELVTRVCQESRRLVDGVVESFQELPDSLARLAAPFVRIRAEQAFKHGDWCETERCRQLLYQAGVQGSREPLARIHLLRGNYRQALELTQEPLLQAQARVALGEQVDWAAVVLQVEAVDGRLQSVPSLVTAGRNALLEGRWWAAENFLKRSVGRVNEHRAEDSLEQLGPLQLRLQFELCMGQPDRALSVAERAAQVFSSKPQAGPWLADWVALCHHCLKNAEQAREQAEVALGLDRAVWGNEHPETAGSLALSGLILGERGVPLLRQAVELRQRVLHPDHPELGALRWLLARQLLSSQPEQGLELLREAIPGAAGLTAARMQLALAQQLARQDDLDEAQSLALAVWQRLPLWEAEQAWTLCGFADEPLVVGLRGPDEVPAMGAATAALLGKLGRLRQDPEQVRLWTGRSKAIRQTRVQARVETLDARLGVKVKSRMVAFELTLHAPGRRLRQVDFHSARGHHASSLSKEGRSVLLLMKDKQPLNRAGEDLDLELEEPLSLRMMAGDDRRLSMGMAAYVVEFFFDFGPSHRVCAR